MRIIFKNPDNTVSVFNPSSVRLDELIGGGLTEQDAMEALVLEVVPDEALEIEIVEDSVIPSDRSFRNAWFKSGVNIDTYIPKAKEIAHTQRRIDRDELFKPLDVQATIPAQAIAAESARQAIRDADALKQIQIDNANNVAELKTAMAIVVS